MFVVNAVGLLVEKDDKSPSILSTWMMISSRPDWRIVWSFPGSPTNIIFRWVGTKSQQRIWSEVFKPVSHWLTPPAIPHAQTDRWFPAFSNWKATREVGCPPNGNIDMICRICKWLRRWASIYFPDVTYFSYIPYFPSFPLVLRLRFGVYDVNVGLLFHGSLAGT